MSRIALRDTEPTLQQAQAQLQVDRAACIAARNTRDRDKAAWEKLLSDPTASEPVIDAAHLTYQQSNAAFDQARLTYHQSLDAHGDAQDRRDARQDYLQTQKDKRDPLKQVESFPQACNVDLPTLMAYLADEWNDVCSDVESGQQYWRFTPSAAYPATDALTRTRINRLRNRQIIILRRWLACQEAFAAVYTSLDDAGYGISRHVSP